MKMLRARALVLAGGVCLSLVTYAADSLMEAARQGDLGLARQLVERGADVTEAARDGQTPLQAAAEGGHQDIVKLLLEHGAGATAESLNAALKRAAGSTARASAGIVSLLLERGADVNARDWEGTALHQAAAAGQTEVIAVLVDRGADVEARDARSNTPLHVAVRNGHLTVVRLLLERGSDVNARGYENSTPLYYADFIASPRDEEMIELLRQRGGSF